jgi:hypothetical protein
MKTTSDVARARPLRPSFAGRKVSVRYRVIMWGNDYAPSRTIGISF